MEDTMIVIVLALFNLRFSEVGNRLTKHFAENTEFEDLSFDLTFVRIFTVHSPEVKGAAGGGSEGPLGEEGEAGVLLAAWQVSRGYPNKPS
jgi:hypothetical protein